MTVGHIWCSLNEGVCILTVMEYAHVLMPINFRDEELWKNRYGIISELGGELL